MGYDENERARRRRVDNPKHSTKHPYGAFEHRVADSPAYADLSFSARSLLVLIVRQLTQDNNGHLQASFAWCKRYGIGSEHTLRAAITDLIEHGMIYRTRSHGANGAWARYAVTWLPIKRRESLFLERFALCAWQNWQPGEKKAPGKKCWMNPAESAVSPQKIRQKVPESPRQKMPPMY